MTRFIQGVNIPCFGYLILPSSLRIGVSDGPGEGAGVLAHMHDVVHKLEALIKRAQAGLYLHPNIAVEASIHPPARGRIGFSSATPSGQVSALDMNSPMKSHLVCLTLPVIDTTVA